MGSIQARLRAAPLSFFALAMALGALILYWRTAAPTVLPGDSGELQFAAWGFWLAHPTGYPLYLILGGLFQHLFPLGDPAFRLNLFSAVCSAAAVGVSTLVFWQVTHSRAASLIAAFTFAVSPLLWSQATRAEVYALNTLFVVVLSCLGLSWRARPQRATAIAFAVTFGLSLAHHRTTILLIPAFAALILNRLDWGDAGHVLKRIGFYTLIAAVPLLLYLYVPLRAGATPYAVLDPSPAPPIVIFENSPRGWLANILGTGFAGALAFDLPALLSGGGLLSRLGAQFNWLAVALGLLGYAALLVRRRFAIAAFVILGTLVYAFFNAMYHIGDIADYYTPLYFFFCVAFAEGTASVVGLLRQSSATRASAFPTLALLGILALVPMQNLFANFSAADQSRQLETRERWQAILDANLPRDAILLSNDRDEMTPLYYMQWVENKRRDLLGLFPKITDDAAYANVVSLVNTVASAARPIYSIKPLPALELAFSLEAEDGELWRVNTNAPAPLRHPTDAALGDAVQVLGWSVLKGQANVGEPFILGVQYKPLRSLDRDFKFSAQIRTPGGDKVAQANDHIPGEGEYPPTRWQAGQVLTDHFEFRLGPDLEPGDYELVILAYDPASGDELGQAELGVFTIAE